MSPNERTLKEHISGNASPTERTMALLRSLGYTVEKVEYNLRWSKKTTRDFCGFADILAFRPFTRPGVLAVQATTAAHLVERMNKINAEPRAHRWLAAKNRIWVIGWALMGPAKSRKTWTPTVRELSASGWADVEPV